MNTHSIFTLGRTLDFRYLPNQLIIILSLFSMLLGLGIGTAQHGFGYTALITGLLFMITTFLTWAIARELDPSHEYAAIVSAIVLLIAIIFLIEIPHFLLLLWFILALRYINQITGSPSSFIDGIILLALSFALMYMKGWFFGIPTLILFLVSARLKTRKALQFFFTICSILFLVILLIFQRLNFTILWLEPLHYLIMLISSLLFVSTILHTRRLTVLGDYSKLPVPKRMIQTSQIVCIISVFFISLGFGNQEFIELYPIWIIFSISGIFSFFERRRASSTE